MSSSPAPSGAVPPRVSVLMAVFNTLRYLPDAVRSISSQGFTDFELLVIDDGSNDGSSEWLRSYLALEPRMKLVSRENRGLVPTRNELLHAARGELVAWMDSDDVAAPGRLAAQVQRFDSDPELVCLGCAVQVVDPDGNRLSIDRFPLSHAEIIVEQQNGGAIKFPTTMMRRDVALAVGGFRGSFKIGEDFDLLLRMSEVGKMANLADTLYSYRQHLASACATLALSWPAYRDEILSLARERREFGSDRLDAGGTLSIDVPRSPPTRRLISVAYASWARQALQNGNRRLAWKYARAAVIAWPLARLGWRTALTVALSSAPAG